LPATTAGLAAALVLLAALGAAAWGLTRWRRRLTSAPTPRRLDKALAATIVLGSGIVTMPALIVATVLVLRNFGLMPDPVADIGFGLAVAAVVAGFGRGVAPALFAPRKSERRIVAFADYEAASYAAQHPQVLRAPARRLSDGIRRHRDRFRAALPHRQYRAVLFGAG